MQQYEYSARSLIMIFALLLFSYYYYLHAASQYTINTYKERRTVSLTIIFYYHIVANTNTIMYSYYQYRQQQQYQYHPFNQEYATKCKVATVRSDRRIDTSSYILFYLLQYLFIVYAYFAKCSSHSIIVLAGCKYTMGRR